MRWRGRKWSVSSNDRYLVHDLNETTDDEGPSLFDVRDAITSLLIDCSYTFSVTEHDSYAEIYVGSTQTLNNLSQTRSLTYHHKTNI